MGLPQEIPGPHDRPRHQVREEKNEEQKMEEASLRMDFAAIDVDRVADRFKGVERDPERNHQHREVELVVPRRHSAGEKEIVQLIQKEAAVLEVAEHAKVHANAGE